MPVDQSPLEKHAAEEPAAHEPRVADAVSKPTLPPAVALAFVIIALLGGLIVIGLRGYMRQPDSAPPELTELQAEANALRTQLNNERMAMGLRPLEGNSEPVEDIAKRLKKDADTMVALAESFQSMLAEKDLELSAKNSELLRSEQLRQSLTAESARLQGEVQRALVGGSDAELLRRDLDAMKSQRDALATELATVRQELAAKGQGVSTDDFADLQRRFEETLRAKEFFEAKVKELEGAPSDK